MIRAYQETAAEVLERYKGHITQYLVDGLLIYLRCSVADEDDASIGDAFMFRWALGQNRNASSSLLFLSPKPFRYWYKLKN